MAEALRIELDEWVREVRYATATKEFIQPWMTFARLV
jgi:hypothetical protein